jgi:hypothetical protein
MMIAPVASDLHSGAQEKVVQIQVVPKLKADFSVTS